MDEQNLDAEELRQDVLAEVESELGLEDIELDVEDDLVLIHGAVPSEQDLNILYRRLEDRLSVEWDFDVVVDETLNPDPVGTEDGPTDEGFGDPEQFGPEVESPRFHY